MFKELRIMKWSLSKPKVLAVIALAVFVLILIVVAVILHFSKGKSAAKNSLPEKVIEIEDPDGVLTGAMVKLQPFVINLRGGKEYLYLTMSLEFFQFAPPENFEAILPKIRDGIIELISQKNSDEVSGVINQEALREELIYTVNRNLEKDNRVVNIYFNSIFVQ